MITMLPTENEFENKHQMKGVHYPILYNVSFMTEKLEFRPNVRVNS